MHRLNQSQTRRAERLADQHPTAELGPMCVAATGKESEVLAWAVYLRTRDDRKAAGTWIEPAGYSGRQTNRRR